MLLTSQTWVSFSRWNSQGDVISFWVVVIHLGFPNNIPLMPHKLPSGSWWLCWCCHCTTSHDEQPACSYRSHSTRWSCLPTLVHPLSVCVAHPSMAHTPQLFFFIVLVFLCLPCHVHFVLISVLTHHKLQFAVVFVSTFALTAWVAHFWSSALFDENTSINSRHISSLLMIHISQNTCHGTCICVRGSLPRLV